MLCHRSLSAIGFTTLAHLTNELSLNFIGAPADSPLLVIRIFLRKILKGCYEVSQLFLLLQGISQLYAEHIVGGSQFGNLSYVEIDGLVDVTVERIDGDQFIRHRGVTGTRLFAHYTWNYDHVAFGALL